MRLRRRKTGYPVCGFQYCGAAVEDGVKEAWKTGVPVRRNNRFCAITSIRYSPPKLPVCPSGRCDSAMRHTVFSE